MKVNLSIQAFQDTIPYLPIETAILIRGDHGIGKSQIVKKIASDLKLPLIDRRLSQMSEGDILGLPTPPDESIGTKFIPVDWFIAACKRPAVLFFDELNRATNEIIQTVFQIVLDRTLGSWILHPETRVFVAINQSNKYTVNDLDPALLDRFWVVDLEPTVEDWVSWGRSNINEHIINFIESNPKLLDPPPDYDPDSVQPSRRSWEKFSNSLKNLKDYDLRIIYNLAQGFLGPEVALLVKNWFKNIDSSIKPEDIINNWSKIKSKFKSKNQIELLNYTNKTAEYLLTLDSLNASQSNNLAKFTESLSGDLRISLWSQISSHPNKVNLILDVHKAISNLVVEIFSKD